MKTKHLLLTLLLAALMPQVAMAQTPQNNTPNNTTRNFYFEDFESITPYTDPEMSGGYFPMLWFYTTKTGTSYYYWPKVCSHSCGNYQIPTSNTLSLGDRSLYMASSSSSEVGDTYAIWNGYGCLVTNISFNSWREANKGTLYLGYVTDPNDVTTFHSLQTLTPPVYTSANANNATFTYTFNNNEIPYGAYPTFHWHQANESTVRSAYLDNVSVTCAVPKIHIANTASNTQITWAEFATLVNAGYSYEGETIYLDEDITATTMVGTNETNCFKGTFNGQGHSITFNYSNTSEDWCAPFHYLNGATIRNLTINGTITANYDRCGGLAGNCYGNNAIINCLSNITINSKVNGDGTHGGFISRIYRGSTTFEGCTFAGRLLGGNTTANGGFVGWSEGNNNYASVSFNNCIYAPIANTMNQSAGATFARGRNEATTGITISNCFYTSSEFQYTQGSQGYTITGQDLVTVTLDGTPTNYNMSHITAYSGNPGLLYDGTIIVGSGDQVSLNFDGGNAYEANHGSLTGTANPYTLTMEAYNTVISDPSLKTVIGASGGSETFYWTPFRNQNKYSLTQQIYTSAELGTSGYIVSIDFYKADDVACTRNLNIYMTLSNIEHFTYGTDWVQVTSADLVFSGTVTFGDNRWTTITLDTPFEYDGHHNVVLTVDDNTGSTNGEDAHFRVFHSISGTNEVLQTLNYYSNTVNSNPLGTPEESINVSSLKNQVRIMKLPLPSAPYSTDFETTCDWKFVNGSCTNQWCWGTAASNGGTHGLYISNNGGTSNAYTITSSAMVYAYKTFYFEAGIYDISYDWKANGESNWDFLRVALVPASVNLEASTYILSGFSTTTLPEGWIALDGGSKLNLSTDWQNKDSYFTVIETTGEYKMVFAWRNDSSVGTNPPAAIDNVNIEAIPCATPRNLTASNIGTTTTELSWLGGLDVESYTVQYRPIAYFRPIYTEGFEYGIDDWTLRDCESNTGVSTAAASSGNAGFSFYNSTTPQYLISPELTGIDEAMDVYFRVRNNHTENLHEEPFYFGYSTTDNENESFTFEEIYSDNVSMIRLLMSVPAGTKYVCWKYASDNCQLYIDDISIGYNVPNGEWQTVSVAGGPIQMSTTLTGLIPETPYQAQASSDCTTGVSSLLAYFTTLPTCVTPTDLAIGDVSATTANLSWTGGPETESYTVKYRTTSAILLTEDFENGLGNWTLRDCASSTGVSNAAAHSGNAGFRFYYSTNPPQYLISPELTDVVEGMKLDFYYMNNSANYPETFQVGFSATDNATTSFTFGDEITASDEQWHLCSETIPAGTKYICWKLNSYDQYCLYIDDIKVGTEGSEWQTATVEGNANEVSATLSGLMPETTYEAFAYPDCNPTKKSEIVNFTTGEACPIPTNFTVDSLTSTTADLIWTAMPEVEDYTVEYRLYHHFSPIFSEGFEYGIDDWTLRNCTGNTGLTTEDAFSGSVGFFFDNNGTTQYLISPELAGIDEEMTLRFYGRHCGHDNYEKVYVGFSATNTDNASFNYVEVNIGAFGEWEFIYDRVTVPAGTKYISFTRSEDNGCPLFIDDISIGLNVPDGEWQYINVAGGTFQGNVTLTDLTPDTPYQAYVYNDCSNGSSRLLYFTTLEACVTPTDLTVGDVSAITANLSWTGGPEVDSYTMKYRTSSHISPVYSEGFEDGFMPTGWTQSGIGTWNVTGGYGYNSIGTHSGTYNVRIIHTDRENETFLISPMLDLSGQIGLYLNFWYINFNWGFPDIDQLYVYYRINEGDWIELWNATEDHQEWTTSGIIPLPNPSANYQIGFKMIDKYGHGVGLDDITIGLEVPAGEWQTATVAGGTTEVNTTLTGLMLETNYEAYVYPDCDPDKVSETVYFTTEAGSVFSITIAGYGTGSGNWHLIASPVTNINPDNVEGMTTGDYDLYRFSPSDVDLEWRNYKAEDVSFNLEAGQGYLYARRTDGTLTFVGTPYSGNGEFALSYDANDDHKCWNLVGNPFDGEAYLDRQYYVMKADGTGINPVAVPATTPIPPYTAVFVKAVAAGDKAVFTRVAP